MKSKERNKAEQEEDGEDFPKQPAMPALIPSVSVSCRTEFLQWIKVKYLKVDCRIRLEQLTCCYIESGTVAGNG